MNLNLYTKLNELKVLFFTLHNFSMCAESPFISARQSESGAHHPKILKNKNAVIKFNKQQACI